MRSRGAVAERFAVPVALLLLATGGLLGDIENGVLTDWTPAAAATAILLLYLLIARIARPGREEAALLFLACLAARNPGAEFWLTTVATVAFVGGRRATDLDQPRLVIIASAIILTIWGAYQRWVLFPAVLPSLEGEAAARIASGRVFSTFILPAQFSAYLATTFCLTLGLAVIPRKSLFYRLAALLQAAGLCLAGSLSGLVAASAGAVQLLGSGKRSAVVALFLLGLLVLVTAPRPEVFDFSSKTNPIVNRARNWANAIDEASTAPILGHGPGSFENLYLSGRHTSHADRVRHPHSWPVLVFYESGMIGLTAWLVLISAFLRPSRDRSYRAAALAFFVASLFDVADQSYTLRALALFLLGASTPHPK